MNVKFNHETGAICQNINFNFLLPKVNTDYIRQAQVLNIDNLRKIILK